MAEAGSGKNFGKVLQKKVFRTKEKVLQNLGKADKTTDEVFEQHVNLFNEQQAVSLRMQKELKHYVACCKEMSAASQSMYRTIKEVYEPEWTGFTEITSAVEQLSVLWEDYMTKVVEQLQAPLLGYVGLFPEMKAKISKRNRKLTDYDCARHNYEAAVKKPDEVRINKMQEELAEAKHVYEAMNEELYVELPALYSSRVGFIASHVNSLSNMEAKFQLESSKLKDSIAEVTQMLVVEVANSGKPYGSIPKTVDPQRGVSSPNTRDVTRLNNAPATPSSNDEGRGVSRSSPSNVEMPPFQRLPSKDDDYSNEHVSTFASHVNNGGVSGRSASGTSVHPPIEGTNADATVTAATSLSANGYVENSVPNSSSPSILNSISAAECVPDERILFRVQATHPYIGEDIDELTFEAGEIITVVPFDDPEEQDDGWLMGVKESTRQKGVFPENFTRRM